jgi:hypothetical protein
MLFFIPEADTQYLKLMIEQHGGIVIYIPEGCCYQITTQEEPDLNLFQKGHVYRH